MSVFHQPVMVDEILGYLLAIPRRVIADCTLGDGGHTLKILQETKTTFVVGMDIDEEALEAARARLSSFAGRFVAVKGDYRQLKSVLAGLGVPRIDAALFDLGVSSRQVDVVERGFSYWGQGPLDMRMDQRSKKTAGDVLMTYSQDELERVLWEYGEERFSRRIAREIVRRREGRPLNTAEDLMEVIKKAVPLRARSGIHPGRRTFQALRIEVNDELSQLKASVSMAFQLLNPGGIVAVLSYHSLEDRLVKQAFRSLEENHGGRILAKKPRVPSEAEIQTNPRSRSAKLRVIERLPQDERFGGFQP